MGRENERIGIGEIAANEGGVDKASQSNKQEETVNLTLLLLFLSVSFFLILS